MNADQIAKWNLAINIAALAVVVFLAWKRKG